MAALLPHVGAGASTPADVAVFTGVARVGETGYCRSDGGGSVSGRGVFAPGFTPPDRDSASTMTLSSALVSGARGIGQIQLCLHLTSSPLPSTVTYVPSLDIFEVLDLLEFLDNPDPGRFVTWRSNGACLDSKAYGGRGEIVTLGPLKWPEIVVITDLGWKVASANKMIVLGRWRGATGEGQLTGVFTFQGGPACFDPEMGAQSFNSAGTFTLHQGSSLTWDDLVEPVQPKYAPDQQFWGDKTRG